MPDSMGAHGCPNGRPSCPDEGNDHNHPSAGDHESHREGDYEREAANPKGGASKGKSDPAY